MLELATCWMLGLSCPPPVPARPTVAILQAAYGREASRGSAKHDQTLEIVSLDCSAMTGDGDHLCWVTFTSKISSTRATFFDVATVSYASGAWQLKSGLCRR